MARDAGRPRARRRAGRHGDGAKARTAGRKSRRPTRRCTSISRTAPGSSSARSRADREVGVDVEDLRRRPRRSAIVARATARPDEVARHPGARADGWRDRFLAVLDAERGVPQGARPRHFGARSPTSASRSMAARPDRAFCDRWQAPTTGGRFMLAHADDRAPARGGGRRRRRPGPRSRSRRFPSTSLTTARPHATPRHQRPAPRPSHQPRRARRRSATSRRTG